MAADDTTKLERKHERRARSTSASDLDESWGAPVADRLKCTSHSERDCFDDCRAKWHAKYVLGVSGHASHPSRRLGSLFEVAFAAKLRTWARSLGAPLGPQLHRVRRENRVRMEEGPPEFDPLAAIREACAAEQWPWSEEHGGTEEAAELALVLVDRAYAAMEFPAGRWRPLVINGATAIQIRLTARLPFPDDSYAAAYYSGGASGILDFAAHDGSRDWRPVLADTKVRAKSLSSDPDLGCDPQLGLYQYLLRENGVRVHLCEQWEILGAPAEEPPKNADGKAISRDQKHRATRETFLAACKRHGLKTGGLPPAKFEEHLAKLDQRRWWQATPGGGTDAEVDDLIREFVATAEVMACIATTPAALWFAGSPVTRNVRTHSGSPCRRCDLQGDCWSLRAAGRPLSDIAAPSKGGAQEPLEVADLAELETQEDEDT